MATIKQLGPEGQLGEEIREWTLHAATMISYYNYLKSVGGNKGVVIRYTHGTAKGEAKNDGFVTNQGYSYEIRIRGEWKDVEIVLRHLEELLGARYLNPKPIFPELPDFISRIKWLFAWLIKGKQ